MTAPQMLDLFRRFEIHRERWIKHLDENGTDNDDWKPTAEESGPREVLWELGWRLRFRGPNETQLALDAGLVPLMCRIMKFTLADNIRFAKYYSKRKEVWQDRSISDIKELREGELAINVLLEASRWPAGARAVASSPELLETIYAPDGGLLQLIGSAKIPFLCYGDGPGRHSCVLIDLLGRTLSVLLHERQKGDREIARQFAALLKERTTRLDGPKSPRSLVNLLQVFKADSAKSRPVFQDPLESRDLQPILPEQLEGLQEILGAALSKEKVDPLPFYTSWYRMETILDIPGNDMTDLLEQVIKKVPGLSMKDFPNASRKESRDASILIPCDACGRMKLDMLRCARCRGVRYCSKECQTQAWPEHKKHCTLIQDKSKQLLNKAMGWK